MVPSSMYRGDKACGTKNRDVQPWIAESPEIRMSIWLRSLLMSPSREGLHNFPGRHCGLGSPNKNPENVAFLEKGGIESLLDGMDLESFQYKLTQERVLRGPAPHRQHLVATCVDENCKRFHPSDE